MGSVLAFSHMNRYGESRLLAPPAFIFLIFSLPRYFELLLLKQF